MTASDPRAGAARAGLLKASDVDPLSPASPLPAGTRDPFSVVKRGGSPPALERGLQEEGRDARAWQGAGSESPSGSSAAPPGLRWGVGPAGAEGCCAPDEPGGPCGDLPQGLCPQEGPSGGSGRPPPGPARGPLLTWGPARAAGRWRGGGGGGGPASPGRRAGVWAPPRRGWAVGREGLARRGRRGGLPGLGKGPEQKWFLFQRLPAWPRPHHSLLINRFLLPSSLPGPQARPAPARLPDPGAAPQPPPAPHPPSPRISAAPPPRASHIRLPEGAGLGLGCRGRPGSGPEPKGLELQGRHRLTRGQWGVGVGGGRPRPLGAARGDLASRDGRGHRAKDGEKLPVLPHLQPRPRAKRGLTVRRLGPLPSALGESPPVQIPLPPPSVPFAPAVPSRLPQPLLSAGRAAQTAGGEDSLNPSSWRRAARGQGASGLRGPPGLRVSGWRERLETVRLPVGQPLTHQRER